MKSSKLGVELLKAYLLDMPKNSKANRHLEEDSYVITSTNIYFFLKLNFLKDIKNSSTDT